VKQSYLENQNKPNNKTDNGRLFVPFSEDLLAAAGSPLGELVPFQLEYRCVRLLDGTYKFNSLSQPAGTVAA
jgi:hypothetical protein